MKIIFLDLDWVLIKFWDTPEIRKSRAEKKQTWWIITDLDDELVKNLLDIVIQTWAKIVISSSWRRSTILMWKLRDQFYNYQIKNKYFSETLWNRVISKTPHSLWFWRWNEILTWLNIHNETCEKWLHISSWIAIDDDSADMKSIFRLWKLIHTKTNEWLNKEQVLQSIKILNGLPKSKNKYTKYKTDLIEI